MALSSCVTYSHQVVLMMFVWWLLSVWYPRAVWLNRIQPVLLIYGMVSLVVWVGLTEMTPILRGMSNVQLMCQVMVHIWVPMAYFLDWYTSRQPNGNMTLSDPFNPLKTPFNWVMGYPCLYAIFIHIVSRRRGYAIYPFLDHVGGQVTIFFIFVLVYLWVWWMSSRRLVTRQQ